MGSIPEPLAERFELLQQLETAYDLLDGLPSEGSETERVFLQGKIDAIERDLKTGEGEALELIERLHSDSRAWLAAHLRFMQGYQWREVAEYVGDSEQAIKIRVYRKLKCAIGP